MRDRTTDEYRFERRVYMRKWREDHPQQRKPKPSCASCQTDLDPKQWAYLAGIFDGEGSVILNSAFNKHGRQRTFSLCVTVVCGTHLSAIEAIHAIVGRHGAVNQQGKKLEPMNGKGSRRQAWRLRIYGDHAAWFLCGVRPYLLMKSPQTEMAIEFQAGKEYRGMRCTREREVRESEAKLALTEMNRRGVQCAH